MSVMVYFEKKLANLFKIVIFNPLHAQPSLSLLALESTILFFLPLQTIVLKSLTSAEAHKNYNNTIMFLSNCDSLKVTE